MTDLLTSLRAADPARHDAPDAAEARRMDAVLDALLRAEPHGAPAPPPAPAPRPARPPQPGRRRRAPFALAGGALAAGAAAVALTLTVGGPSDTGVAPASASVVLGRLAQADATTPDGTGRFAYRKTIAYTTHMRGGAEGRRFAVVLPHVREQWLDDRGDGVVRERVDESAPRFPTPEDRAAYETAPRPPALPGAGGVRVRGITEAGLGAAAIRALPTDDVPALRAAIVAGMEQAGLRAENPALAGAAQLLGSPLTPQPVRAALFQLLRAEPGASVSEDVRDPLGRGGVAITFTSPAWRTTLLFDPATGDLRATRSVGTQELPGRELTDWSVIVASGRRATAPEAPTADELTPTGPQRLTPATPPPGKRTPPR